VSAFQLYEPLPDVEQNQNPIVEILNGPRVRIFFRFKCEDCGKELQPQWRVMWRGEDDH
jgi:hypothetical protein